MNCNLNNILSDRISTFGQVKPKAKMEAFNFSRAKQFDTFTNSDIIWIRATNISNDEQNT